jgi:hypothetical protein
VIRADRGSALAEFVLVGSLVTLLFLALLQLAIDFHVRNVLAACAADGARYAANADVRSPTAGVVQARAEVRQLLDQSVIASARIVEVDRQPIVVVTVKAQLPTVFGLLPALPVRVQGESLVEP